MSWLAWALLSAVFAGLTAVLAKIGVTEIPPTLAVAIRTSVVVVLAWGAAFAARETMGPLPITPRAWIFLVLSGLATGLSWLCYFHALRLAEALKVAAVDKLSVVFVALFAAAFLGEPFTVKTLFGVGFITAGSWLLVK